MPTLTQSAYHVGLEPIPSLTPRLGRCQDGIWQNWPRSLLLFDLDQHHSGNRVWDLARTSRHSSAILTWLPRIMSRHVLFFLQCFRVLLCLVDWFHGLHVRRWYVVLGFVWKWHHFCTHHLICNYPLSTLVGGLKVKNVSMVCLLLPSRVGTFVASFRWSALDLMLGARWVTTSCGSIMDGLFPLWSLQY